MVNWKIEGLINKGSAQQVLISVWMIIDTMHQERVLISLNKLGKQSIGGKQSMGWESINEMGIYQWDGNKSMGWELIDDMGIYQSVEINQWGNQSIGVGNQSISGNQSMGNQSMRWEFINGVGINQWDGNQSMGWESINGWKSMNEMGINQSGVEINQWDGNLSIVSK